MGQTSINPVLEADSRRPLERNRVWLVVVVLLLFVLAAAALILLQSPPTLQ